jgi:hypothetical protein
MPARRPTIGAATDAATRRALKTGNSIRKIATTLNVGIGTVQRIKVEMSAAV